MADEPIDYFLRGVDTGSGLMGRVQQARMQRQQMQQSAELFPLHKAQLEQNLDIQSEKIRTDFLNKEHVALGLKSRNAVSEIMAGPGTPDEKEQGLYSILQSNSFAVNDPLWQESMKSLDTSKRLLQQKAISDEVTARTLGAANIRADVRLQELQMKADQAEKALAEKSREFDLGLQQKKELSQQIVDARIEVAKIQAEKFVKDMGPHFDLKAFQAELDALKKDPDLIGEPKKIEARVNALLEKYKAKGTTNTSTNTGSKDSSLPLLKFDPTSMTIPK